MDMVIHKFLSYSKSHIYELHAILSATITFLLMFPIKKPIKAGVIRKLTAQASVTDCKDYRLKYKRNNMLVLGIAVGLTMIIHAIVSFVSPLVAFSWPTTGLSVAFTLTEYAIYDQCVCKKENNNE